MVSTNFIKMKKLLLILGIAILQLASTNPSPEIKEILNSGDGTSYETAFVVESIEDEYRLLKYLGKQAISQMLVIENGEFYDILKTKEGFMIFKFKEKQNKLEL